MTMHVLVPVDGSDPANDALEYALTQFPDAEVTVLHVLDPLEAGVGADPMSGDLWEGWYESARSRSETVLEEATERAREHGVDIETATEVGRPAHTIVAYAEDHDVDHVVIGSHGRSGINRILLGSVAELVVRRASVPVTVIR